MPGGEVGELRAVQMMAQRKTQILSLKLRTAVMKKLRYIIIYISVLNLIHLLILTITNFSAKDWKTCAIMNVVKTFIITQFRWFGANIFDFFPFLCNKKLQLIFLYNRNLFWFKIVLPPRPHPKKRKCTPLSLLQMKVFRYL